MSDTVETTDLATLLHDERAQAVLKSSNTEIYLAELVSEAATITQVTDADSREQAHRIGMKLKNARTTIKKTGKTARDDATAFANAVIREEKRLIAITEGEETRVMGLRDAYDAKIEAEKQAKARRDAEIMQKIAGIRGLARELSITNATSDEIAAEREALAAFDPPESVFGEFVEDCCAALQEADTALNELYTKVLQQEQAAAAIVAEKARLEAERQALEAERAAYEAERRAFEAHKAAEAARLAAEVQQVEEEQPAEAEPVEDEDTAEDVVETVEPLALEQDGADSEPVAETEATQEPVIPTDWRIRSYAMLTADQFSALADKVDECGFVGFATDLRDVAEELRKGTHDWRLSQANQDALIAADTRLLDRTVEALDTLETQAAA